MVKVDQALRDQLIKSDFKDKVALQRMQEQDARDTSRLKEIVQAHGWPGASLVGKQGAHDAWLLVQHADLDAAFQRRCLALMEKLPANEVSGKDLAYLTDRVLLAEGKPQRYGTQFEKDAAGKWVPKQLEDPGRADERRKAVGLEPLADYAKRMAATYDQH